MLLACYGTPNADDCPYAVDGKCRYHDECVGETCDRFVIMGWIPNAWPIRDDHKPMIVHGSDGNELELH